MEARSVAHHLQHLWRIALEVAPSRIDHLQVNAQLLTAPVTQRSQDQLGVEWIMQVGRMDHHFAAQGPDYREPS
jgi:hypothetical protein